MSNRIITLFDRINLANCAVLRSETTVLDGDRFLREYETARMWTRYRVYNSPGCQFVEVD